MYIRDPRVADVTICVTWYFSFSDETINKINILLFHQLVSKTLLNLYVEVRQQFGNLNTSQTYRSVTSITIKEVKCNSRVLIEA